MMYLHVVIPDPDKKPRQSQNALAFLCVA